MSTLTSPQAAPATHAASRFAADPARATDPTRQALAGVTRAAEPDLLPGLLEAARLDPAQAEATHRLALHIAGGVRERARDSGRAGLVQGLLQEFALSSQEGVALMCLAEALLRIPDDATRDALIRDKISRGHWDRHLGQSPSLFVNAATWGLLVTGRLVATHSDAGLTGALKRVLSRGGEPLIRKGVDMAMRLMGEQFVTGQTIEQALDNARPREAQGYRYSYDMLGEAALTAQDAQRYLTAYENAIHAIGQASSGRGLIEGPGISIKLSALHPRYSRAQAARVRAELVPRLAGLARLARHYDIGLNIDAEESDRLELSLELLRALCEDPALAGWNGVGFVIQAYGKRCPVLVDALIALARRTQRRLMVRLVKGAYWDSEIKRAQLDGLDDYPVYTRKVHTDVAYLACARRLLAAPDAVYPQFATHNAHTVAALHTLAGPDYTTGQYEFQCLHGMGEPLYEQIVGPAAEARLATALGRPGLSRPCRIYAPVGSHDTLLAYLVRRLLENGANTSFVNQVANDAVPLDTLVADPVRTVEDGARAEGRPGLPNPAIPLPAHLYGAARLNSRGLDLADEPTLAALERQWAEQAAPSAGPGRWSAGPLLGRRGDGVAGEAGPPVVNPADARDTVGPVREATPAEVDHALRVAADAAAGWAATPAAARGALLLAASHHLQAQCLPLCGLLVREAGKTWANAIGEVREAVDFLRWYGAQAQQLPGDAELSPLGPVVCISPWNFPLAIFIGQVAAALAAGNPVLAKPAEQTPLVATEAVRLLHAAGLPREVLQLLPGRGETVGAALVADARTQGVLFTGSHAVARLIARTLAQRVGAHGQPVPLVAETGGQNAMWVDTSALPEQVVQDVLASAFDSAGQRCSALRLLCVQEEAADRILEMLLGAMREQRLGDPSHLATDIGPLIDAEALAAVQAHVQRMRARGLAVHQPLAAAAADAAAAGGHFMAPTVIEIDQVADLRHEVFGPVLHVVRWQREDLPALVAQVNALGFGLTGGVHTRIDETVARIAGELEVGNLYVNRNTVGAVVGVQPFGGDGLSGTGPKAGGPLALLRLLARRPDHAARDAVRACGADGPWPLRGIDPAALLPAPGPTAAAAAALLDWARAQASHAASPAPDGPAPATAVASAMACRSAVALAARAAALSPCLGWRLLAGPTGEANLYAVLPRHTVLCLAGGSTLPAAATPDALLPATALALALGCRVLWPASAQALWARLPADTRDGVSLVQDWASDAIAYDAVLLAGSAEDLADIAPRLAARDGPLVPLAVLDSQAEEPRLPLEVLVRERSLSVNTAAAGGNATLMTIG